MILDFSGQSLVVDHDGFTIGSSRQCDLTLADPLIPGLHSVIHLQSGAVWIEAADDQALLRVNGRPYRRMALRHEDLIRIGETEFTIQLTTATVAVETHSSIEEDLSLLTAEELCDRIVSEQSMADEFAAGQRSGWMALLQAIESASDEVAQSTISHQQVSGDQIDQGLFGNLLEQIQGLNDSVTDHTRELNDHEKQVLEATSIIEESQKRAIQQLDEILEKLKSADGPNELRASA